MKIYANELSNSIYPSLLQLFPVQVQRHIVEILDSGSTSRFYYKIENKTPNVNIYLIEINSIELYSLCHFFTYDQLGVDYLYQSLTLDILQTASQIISQLTIF